MKFIILVAFLIGTSLAEEEKPKEVLKQAEEQVPKDDGGAGIFDQVLAGVAQDEVQPDPAHINEPEPEGVKRDQRHIIAQTYHTYPTPLLYLSNEEYAHPYNIYYNPLVRLHSNYYYQPLKTVHHPYVVQTLAKK